MALVASGGQSSNGPNSVAAQFRVRLKNGIVPRLQLATASDMSLTTSSAILSSSNNRGTGTGVQGSLSWNYSLKKGGDVLSGLAGIRVYQTTKLRFRNSIATACRFNKTLPVQNPEDASS